MEITFHILLHLKTMDGHENFGKFCIGSNKEVADSIFHQLKGNSNVTDQCGLHLEFIEMHDNLPYNIRLLSCTLDQLAENVRIITKETFKRFAVWLTTITAIDLFTEDVLEISSIRRHIFGIHLYYLFALA